MSLAACQRHVADGNAQTPMLGDGAMLDTPSAFRRRLHAPECCRKLVCVSIRSSCCHRGGSPKHWGRKEMVDSGSIVIGCRSRHHGRSWSLLGPKTIVS